VNKAQSSTKLKGFEYDSDLTPLSSLNLGFLGKIPGRCRDQKTFVGWTDHQASKTDITSWIIDQKLRDTGISLQSRLCPTIDIDDSNLIAVAEEVVNKETSKTNTRYGVARKIIDYSLKPGSSECKKKCVVFKDGTGLIVPVHHLGERITAWRVSDIRRLIENDEQTS